MIVIRPTRPPLVRRVHDQFHDPIDQPWCEPPQNSGSDNLAANEHVALLMRGTLEDRIGDSFRGINHSARTGCIGM